MKFELYAPQVVGQPSEKGLSIYPAQDMVDMQSRVYVMCYNALNSAKSDLCAQTVGHYIQSHFDPKQLFTVAMLQAALEEACASEEARLRLGERHTRVE